jgi:hypothetical protein
LGKAVRGVAVNDENHVKINSIRFYNSTIKISPMQTVSGPKKLYQHLYAQALTAIALAILLSHFFPETGIAMKPLDDGFIKLIKMIIAPIIFCTVV